MIVKSEEELSRMWKGAIMEAERVVTEENAKIFNVVAVLGYLESHIYDLTNAKTELPEEPVRVEAEDGRLLGHGIFDIVNKRLLCRMSLDYACEERLLIETKEIPLYAVVEGHMECRHLCLEFQSRVKVDVIQLKKVRITRTKPDDSRIQPLGHPILE